ncbi:DUF488 domain-containing protein [Patescibacteria group bacterium]|nr:DUF488 domain-containing protein [Patescibacteria group bacterium]
MSLYTKSVQAPVSPDDGIRVCIMRRPGADVVWDIWMPHLAPSHEVLTARHQNTMTKPEFNAWFEEHVLKGEREYLDILIEMAKKHTVTILCWEEDPQTCHRKLVAEECRKIDPELEVVIR